MESTQSLTAPPKSDGEYQKAVDRCLADLDQILVEMSDRRRIIQGLQLETKAALTNLAASLSDVERPL